MQTKNLQKLERMQLYEEIKTQGKTYETYFQGTAIHNIKLQH